MAGNLSVNIYKPASDYDKTTTFDNYDGEKVSKDDANAIEDLAAEAGGKKKATTKKKKKQSKKQRKENISENKTMQRILKRKTKEA